VVRGTESVEHAGQQLGRLGRHLRFHRSQFGAQVFGRLEDLGLRLDGSLWVDRLGCRQRHDFDLELRLRLRDRVELCQRLGKRTSSCMTSAE